MLADSLQILFSTKHCFSFIDLKPNTQENLSELEAP